VSRNRVCQGTILLAPLELFQWLDSTLRSRLEREAAPEQIGAGWPGLFAEWFAQVWNSVQLASALCWNSLDDGIGGSGGDDPT
jgi:hypothetical protein